MEQPEELSIGNSCLPHDIMTQLLARLPAKSLGRFMSVCKSWHSMIRDDRRFAELHRAMNSRDPKNCYFMNFWFDSTSLRISFTDNRGRDVQKSIQFDRKKICCEPWVSSVVLPSMTLDGLVCIYSACHYHAFVMKIGPGNAVPLPKTRFDLETVLPLMNDYRQSVPGYFYLGYDLVIKEYKVLNIITSVCKPLQKCEIYTIGTVSRRLLDDPPAGHRLSMDNSFSCSINGAIYWMSLGSRDEAGFRPDPSLIVFDVSKEVFRVTRISGLCLGLRKNLCECPLQPVVLQNGRLAIFDYRRGKGVSLFLLDPDIDSNVVSMSQKIDGFETSSIGMVGLFNFGGISPGGEIVLWGSGWIVYVDWERKVIRKELFNPPLPRLKAEYQSVPRHCRITSMYTDSIVRLRDCDLAFDRDGIFD